MMHLVKEAQSGYRTTIFKTFPADVFHHRCDTTRCTDGIIIIHISGGSSLYLLEDLDVSLVMWISHNGCIVEHWSDHCGICCCLHLFCALFEVTPQESKSLVCFPGYLCFDHVRSSVTLTPRYLLASVTSRTWLWNVYEDWKALFFLFFPEVMLMMVHFDGLKLICHARSQSSSAERSS